MCVCEWFESSGVPELGRLCLFVTDRDMWEKRRKESQQREDPYRRPGAVPPSQVAIELHLLGGRFYLRPEFENVLLQLRTGVLQLLDA